MIAHTDCGMLTFYDEEFTQTVHADTGHRPGWSPEAFQDLDEHVRHSIRRIRTNPYVPHTDQIRGFVFDVTTGQLRHVA